jgi:hypothetical protein
MTLFASGLVGLLAIGIATVGAWNHDPAPVVMSGLIVFFGNLIISALSDD